MSLTFKILMNSLFGVTMTRVQNFTDFKIVMTEDEVDKLTVKPNFISRNNVNENLSIVEMGKLSVIYSYPILIGSIILQNSKVHMYDYLYNIYPRLFGHDYKVLYMDTDSIYAKLNINYEKSLKILENNKHLFGKNLGQMCPENLFNQIKEGIFLSSKSYSYICKNDIPKNENKIKNNILHAKGISNYYTQQYIDHDLFKQTLLNNSIPYKIKFNTISVRKQKITTREIEKKNIEFLNDKRYIENINSNILHTLYIE